MGRAVRVLGVVLGLLVAGTHSAFAQAVVTGTVKDITGAVLPGATVEVASPALIEKVRSAVSDSTGQYRIVDLRPGIYTVTCTLTGFNTSKREGIELAGTGTVSLNFELKVGAIEETVTVTGETPLVDLQSTSTERTVSRELLDAVPSGRTVHNMAALIPGITVTATGISAQDVGGSSVGGLQQAAIHGGSTGDQRVLMDGLPLNTAQGNLSGFISNMSTTQEFTIDTSGVSAEDNAGGVRMNIVPREGGNTYRSTIYADWSTPGLTASNFNDDLAARHMVAPNPLKNLKETYTFNPAGGGPIMKDKIWFYLGGNYTRLQQHVNIFPNLNANNPSSYLYVADTSKEQSVYDVKLWSLNGRLTTQVNPKNKFSFYIDHQYRCICAFANATTSPEAQAFSAYPAQHLISATWTSPVTSRLLLDAAYLNRLENWGMRLNPATSRDAIRVNDQVLNVTYRSFGEDTFNYNGNNNARASLSYVTGAHAFKGGFQAQWADHKDQAYSNPQNIDYTFSNQLPTQITMYADPRFTETQSLDFGLYVQDRYTVGRFTLNGGLRYDRFHSYYPAATVGPVALAPNRNLSFPAGDGVDWKDITYRLGSAWDVFGNGKTALKITLSKYLGAQATTGTFASSLNPANRITNSTTRPWDDLTFQVGDPRRGNFVVDCDLLNAAKNNECGPLNSNTFGQSVIATNYDPAILNGWGIRNYNWEFGASVQHEIASRVSVDVGYFRRWYGNLTTTFNRAVAASDFGQFNYVAPVDPALPGGGGQTIGPLYNLNQNQVGKTDNFLTLSDNVGGQTQRWHGVDANVRVRARNGLSLQGGFSTGTTLTESCAIRTAHPDIATLNPYCLQNTNWLTQAKGLVTYAVPRVDVQVSAGLQSLPGPVVAANQTVPGSIFVPQLQRPYTGSSTATINLAQPGTTYGDRAYQLDLRVGKVLRYGRLRTSINADLFNMLNASAVVSENTTYSTADATLWRRPLAIMPGRLVKLSAQVDF